MGMYDQIICEVEQTKPHWGIGFQTKDLECMLLEYKLTNEGLFQLVDFKEKSWKTDKLETPKKNRLYRQYQLLWI